MIETKFLPEDYNEELMKKQFEDSYELLCETNEPFHIKMQKVFDKREINASKFVECTGLYRQYYSKFRSVGYVPNMNTFISVCMGLNLDLPTAESLLASLRHGFEKTNKLHCAYMFLLTHYQGLCIDDCNEILRSLGFVEEKYLLGSFEKK